MDGLSIVPCTMFVINCLMIWLLVSKSEWCSLIRLITQLIASLTFPFWSENIAIKFWKAWIIIYKKFCLFEPSVIDPRAINEAYFIFQSWDWRLAETKVITGVITTSPWRIESLIKAQAADYAWPHSSSSSSSSKLITWSPYMIIWTSSAVAFSLRIFLLVPFAFLSISSSAKEVQNSNEAAPILLFVL